MTVLFLIGFMLAAVFAPEARAESRYTVQIAALSSESAARMLVEKAAENGIDAYYVEVRNPGKLRGLYYRVRTGIFDEKTQAKNFVEARLIPLGYKFWIDSSGPEPEEDGKTPEAVETVEAAEETQTAEIQRIIVEIRDTIEIRDTLVLAPEIQTGLELQDTQEKSFLDRNKNIVCFSLFMIAASGLAVAIWQDIEASSKSGKAAWLHTEIATGDPEVVSKKQSDYNKITKEVRRHELTRNGFYIGAAAFAVAFGVIFFF